MNRYTLISQEWERLNTENAQLEEEYKDKIKGQIYQQRKFDLVKKQHALKQKALAIGTSGVLCKVSGKRSRPSRKNPSILIHERFNLFFIDVTEEEVSFLVKLHVKNLIQYKVEFYKPGLILTTD